MKRCSKCLKRKTLTEFYFRKTGSKAGQYYNHCKICLKERGKNYYRNNRERQLALANIRRREYRKKRRNFINKQKDKPCTDCGKKYPHYVMDFDHRNGNDKAGNIAHLLNQNFWSYEKLLEEIKKCDIVCANCHRIRTFNRLELKTLK